MKSLQCFINKEIFINYHEVCLETNDKQATKMPKIY